MAETELDPDLERRRSDVADAVATEAVGCVWSMMWLYIGLPVVALLLIWLLVSLDGCTNRVWLIGSATGSPGLTSAST